MKMKIAYVFFFIFVFCACCLLHRCCVGYTRTFSCALYIKLTSPILSSGGQGITLAKVTRSADPNFYVWVCDHIRVNPNDVNIYSRRVWVEKIHVGSDSGQPV